MPTKNFNWLHLTDYHCGICDEAGHWPNVREALFDDLSSLHEKSGPWNAVFFTGDFVQSGAKEEYESFDKTFLTPLLEHLHSIGSEEVSLFTVPGNHDLVRPPEKNPKAAARLMIQRDGFHQISDEFWSNPKSEYREVVTDAFRNYDEWQKRRQPSVTKLKTGILPGDFTTSLSIAPSSDSPIHVGIAGLNSSFLQLAGGDYSERLVISRDNLAKHVMGIFLHGSIDTSCAFCSRTTAQRGWISSRQTKHIVRSIRQEDLSSIYLAICMRQCSGLLAWVEANMSASGKGALCSVSKNTATLRNMTAATDTLLDG